MPSPVRVFLSHAAKDRSFAERIAGVLDRHRLRYWYSRRHIVGAQQWHDEIGKALERCNWFVLVLTPAAVASKWVKHELMFALDTKAYKDHIVVLDHRAARWRKLSWTLRDSQWVPFREDFDEGSRKMLGIWIGKYRAAGAPAKSARRGGSRPRR